MTDEPLVCRFCGREFPDMRGQLPGLEDPPPTFCPACLKAGAVEIEWWDGRVEAVVIRDVERIERPRPDPSRRPRQRSRA